MGKTALLAVGGGGLSGAAVLAALSGSPLGMIAVYLAPLPLLAAGLALGTSGFGIAASSGLVVALLFGGFAAAGLYGGMHVIPSWLLVQQAMRPQAGAADGWRPIGDVLAVVTVLIAFVVAATCWSARSDAGIEESVRGLLTAVSGMVGQFDEATRTELVDQVAPLFPGFAAVMWLVLLIGNAVLAQALLTFRGLNRRPRPDWTALRLPRWFDWPLVAAAAVGLVGSGDLAYIARNVVVILLAAYFLVGLAVVHAFGRRSASPSLVLAAFYVLMTLFFVLAAALVAALGVAEQWIGVRRRISAGPPAAKD
ncbi:MAG: DUF2232 domain-containing protein [Rhodospirillales bacterium]|nr:DUF2232 domain-containing protein [Rhodospirillales bacterium]